MTTNFTITKDHLTISKRMAVEWQDIETGAPAIDPKRPYGNSTVAKDIAEILGWPLFTAAGGGSHLSQQQHDKALQLHKDMEVVLQIILSTQSFKAGNYVKENEFDYRSWKWVSNGGKKK